MTTSSKDGLVTVKEEEPVLVSMVYASASGRHSSSKQTKRPKAVVHRTTGRHYNVKTPYFDRREGYTPGSTPLENKSVVRKINCYRVGAGNAAARGLSDGKGGSFSCADVMVCVANFAVSRSQENIRGKVAVPCNGVKHVPKRVYERFFGERGITWLVDNGVVGNIESFEGSDKTQEPLAEGQYKWNLLKASLAQMRDQTLPTDEVASANAKMIASTADKLMKIYSDTPDSKIEIPADCVTFQPEKRMLMVNLKEFNEAVCSHKA